MKNEFTTIFKFCQANGQLVNKAKSPFGADRWEINIDGFELAATLEDDGYTRAIIFNDCIVRTTVGHDLIFSKGNEKELQKLYHQIINLPL